MTALGPDDCHVRWQVKVREEGADIGAPLDGSADQSSVLLSALVSGLQHHAGVVLAGVSNDASGPVPSQLGSGLVQECGPLPLVVEGGNDLGAAPGAGDRRVLRTTYRMRSSSCASILAMGSVSGGAHEVPSL